MIVDRIEEYLNGPRAKVEDVHLETAMGHVERTFRRNLGDRDDAGNRRRISGSLPWYCPRRAYYTIAGAPREAVKGRSLIAFLMGDVLEAAVVVLARQAGVRFSWPNDAGDQMRLEQTFRTPAGIETVVGHLDLVVEADDDQIAGDVKSMADYSFREFQKAATQNERQALEDPTSWWSVERWGYVAQLRFYLWLLELSGQGSGSRGFFVGVNKNTGHLAELWIDRDQETIDVFKRAIPALVAARAKYDAAANAVRETVLSNGGTDEEAAAAVARVPLIEAHGLPGRPRWHRLIRLEGQNQRADGTKGPILEIDTDKKTTQGQGWRCGYCPWVLECHPGFDVVPLKSGPKFRKAAD